MMDKKMIDKLINDVETPFYVFDIDVLKSRINYLKKMMPMNVTLCYAMKANPFLVKEIDDIIEKYEVCSYGEYKICEELGVDLEKLVISGVYKDKESMEDILSKRKKVNLLTIESLNQIELLDKLTKKNKRSMNLILRLTSGNQFGMKEEDIEYILNNRGLYDYLNIVGIQYFSGTQKTNVKRIAKELNYLDEYLKHLESDLGYVVEELEYGPGFAVEYFEVKEEFLENDYLKEISNLISGMNYKGRITLELGRSIAASCGSYFTKVVDIKTNNEGNFAILDGGMHHMAYYGQMMAMKKPKMDLYPKRDNKNGEEWNLCGALCTINDLIVKKLPVCDMKVGDVFHFKNTGAYSMTEGISLFLSRDLPKVVFVRGKNYEIVRENVGIYKLNMPYKERSDE